METLHVTNGESAAATIRATSIGGAVLCWDDVLHEGPLANLPRSQFNALRGRFFEEQGWGDAAAIAAELTRRDELLEQAVADGTQIVLWFEHDLFDQLQLLQALAALGNAREGQVELVQTDCYLGSLDPDELESLWPTRRAVDPETTALAHDCWAAVCEGRIDDVLQRDTSPFPHLAAALRRMLEEREPLSRTKRQLLRALRKGPLRPPEAFASSQSMEDAIFLGDEWCYAHLHELEVAGLVTTVGGGPMPLPPPRGELDAFTRVVLDLTAEGRALV